MVVDQVPGEEKEVEYEDIVKYEPIPFMIVTDDESNAYFWSNMNHSLIIRILRQGPQTLRDIVLNFNEIAKEDTLYDEKSETTIYRYVKALEDAGLVTPAGRRVFYGKTATEILYARTARVFQTWALPLSYWHSDRGRKLFSRIYAALSKVYPNHKTLKKCLSDYIYKFEQARDLEFNAVLEKLDKEEVELITEGDWWEISQVIRFTGTFGVILNQPELLEELVKCFKKGQKQ